MLIDLSTAKGIVPTCLENVRIVRANAHYAREPVFFEPSIVILANGCKKFYLGEQTVTYDPYHCFVLSVPLHFECETFTAQNRPLLGLSIHVDMHTLSELATWVSLTGRHGRSQRLWASPLQRIWRASIPSRHTTPSRGVIWNERSVLSSRVKRQGCWYKPIGRCTSFWKVQPRESEAGRLRRSEFDFPLVDKERTWLPFSAIYSPIR